MSLFGWFKTRLPKATCKPTRCGTPTIQSGGILLATTGNVVTIIRKTAGPSKAFTDGP